MQERRKPLSSPIFWRKRALWHILFWVTATIYFSLSFRGRDNSFLGSLYDTLYYLPAHIFLVYYLLYFLTPYFILKKKFFLFTVFLLPAVVLSILYISYIDRHIFITSERFNNRFFFRALFANFNLCGIAVSIKLFKYWYHEKEAKQEAEKNNLIAQLQLLKSQIHPHFLFNTLNNLYSLTLNKSDSSPQVVLKLSALLRYILYECDVNDISLDKEIEMIRTFVELEQFRYGERLDLSLHVSGDTEAKRIAPLLLLPFVENCFKYGVSQQIEQCWINMDLSVEGNILYLKFSNSRLPSKQSSGYQDGIGLKNVKKRLDLLYSGVYLLKILPDDETFTVSLEIQLKPIQLSEKLS
jgi:sensor histidine kinase YesM